MVKIAFADFWSGFDKDNNFITDALKKITEYEVVEENPDFLIYSTFSKNFLKYNCPRIFFTGENCVPDFNLCDYAIGFDEISFADRYTRFPLYAACYKADFDKALSRVPAEKEGFCSMVVSNGNTADSFRDELFEALCSKYKKVASGGRYKNNIDQPDGVDDKEAFLAKYKFNLACENVSYPGYCTEKIVQAFAAGTVPIYWGDPKVAEYFNPEAFINLNDCKSVDQAIEIIKRVDADDELYRHMINAPVIVNEEYSKEKLEKDFENWLREIVNQPKEQRFRRTRQCFNADYEQNYKDQLHAFEHHADPLYSIVRQRIKNTFK